MTERAAVRHRPHGYHWSLLPVALVLAAGLLVWLVVTVRPLGAAGHLQAPVGSMSTEVDASTAGMAQDLNQLSSVDVSGVDLNESALGQ